MLRNICFSAAIALAGSAWAATTTSTPGDWTVRERLPLAQFVIQSHRGAGEMAPENTLEAFELGWKLGTWPEADLRTTKDGVIVAFHDGSFKRTVRNAPAELRKKGVADLTFAELSKLDVGGWKGEQFLGRRVSRITDVFALMQGKPERHLYLDIKNVDLDQLAREVRQHEVTRQILFTTTHYELIQQWKRLMPESDTLHWMGGTEGQLAERLAKLRIEGFAGITQLQLHVRMNTNAPTVEPFDLSRKFLREVGAELRARGILYQSLPWGADRPETYWQLLDLGVMSFATDHPVVTRQAVQDYYSPSALAAPKARE